MLAKFYTFKNQKLEFIRILFIRKFAEKNKKEIIRKYSQKEWDSVIIHGRKGVFGFCNPRTWWA